jgi:AcrR family transcriptional regulator
LNLGYDHRMPSTEQSRRRYNSAGRKALALANRERILETARTLFIERGYAGTSIADIAAAADVSAPTVFSGFGSKVNLLKEAVETTLVGDTSPVPLHERPAMRHVHDGPTAETVLSRLATLIADLAPEISPIAAVMYAAADTDPAIADLVRTFDGQRLAGATMLATTVMTRLGDDDPARLAEIRDTIWTLNSPHLYLLLVTQRGWSVQRYGEWIRRALVALVL